MYQGTVTRDVGSIVAKGKNEKRNGSGYGDTYRFNKPRKPAREYATSVVQSTVRNRASCGPVWDKSDPALEICPTPRELVRTMPSYPSSGIVRNKLETVPWLKREHVTRATSSICVISHLHTREDRFRLWTCASISRHRFPIDLNRDPSSRSNPRVEEQSREDQRELDARLHFDIWQVFLFGDLFLGSWYRDGEVSTPEEQFFGRFSPCKGWFFPLWFKAATFFPVPSYYYYSSLAFSFILSWPNFRFHGITNEIGGTTFNFVRSRSRTGRSVSRRKDITIEVAFPSLSS